MSVISMSPTNILRICLGLRKPSNLKYNEYIEECSQALGHAGNADSDYLIPYFVRIQQLSEEISVAFDYSTTNPHRNMDSNNFETLGLSFRQQLSHIEGTFPSKAWQNRKFMRILSDSVLTCP